MHHKNLDNFYFVKKTLKQVPHAAILCEFLLQIK
jgi:hypothetical protein